MTSAESAAAPRVFDAGSGPTLLFVHAHPDDESIATGATMARYAAMGANVVLVTCTLGEEGEVVVPELGHLAAAQTDGLGKHRIGELAAAMAVLGVKDHRFLGGPGRWRDSGMMGDPANDNPGCFWRADFAEATRELVAVIREIRPQVVVTYDENGGYGHPDHIQAHRVTVAAIDAAADPGYEPVLGPAWSVPKFYYTALPRSMVQAGIDVLRERGVTSFFGPEVTSADDLPGVTPDELVTTEIDARAHLPEKMAAMRAHATQIAVDGPFFALADGVGQQAFGVEHYRLIRGALATSGPDQHREHDLLAGLDFG